MRIHLANPRGFCAGVDRAIEIVERAGWWKCEVVRGDEREQGDRMSLNLGHTLGHALEQAAAYEKAYGHPLAPEIDKARKQPLQKFTADFLNCRQAPVLGATFLDAYTELPPRLAARTGHPTLVIVAGKDETVPDLAARLPSDVQKAVVEGASHFFPDLYNEDAADLIAKFLTRDGQPPAR